MDSQRIEMNEETVTMGPWSAWSEWGPKGWWFLAISIRRRTRTVSRQVSNILVQTRCGIPAGATSTSGWFRPWATWTTRTPIGSNFRPDSLEVQEEWRWFDPPKEHFDWLATAAPAIPSGVRLTIETNWIKSLKGVVGHRAWMDGKAYSHLKPIETASLERGHHAFDLEIDMQDGDVRHHHVAFAVVDPLTIRFEEPVTRFRCNAGADEANGGTLRFIVKNVTSSDLLTKLELVSVEEGWAAVVPGESVVEIPSGEERELELLFELMNMSGLNERGIAAFTVAASALSVSKPPGLRGRYLGVTTGYVAFEGEPALLQEARKINRAMQHADIPPMTFGDPTSSPKWKL